MYDNGCQLDKYVRARITNNNRTHAFEDVVFVVDRLHLKGHVAECKKSYNPDLYEHLDDVGTSINETRNSWISGYKHMVIHMNSMRYHMFFYIVFNEYNRIFSEGNINICESFNVNKKQTLLNKNFISSDDE